MDSHRRNTFGSLILFQVISNFLFLAKWLTLAFMLESLMLAYVPADMIAKLVGGNGVTPIIISTVVAVPAYLNGFAAPAFGKRID